MAPPQRTSSQPPPQQGVQHPVVDIAAMLAAGGAALAPAAVPAAGAAAAPVGVGLTAAAVAKITAETLQATAAHMGGRQRQRAKDLTSFLEQQYPERPPSQIREAVSGEVAREKQFAKKMAVRLQHDLPEALNVLDPDERRAKVKQILEREQRYIAMREEAMNDRAIATMERLSVKAQSPKGAYWKLSPLVKEHTPDCIAMGEKFWPWKVLDEINPPTHPGCRCSLLTLDEAVALDYMDPEHADTMDHAALKKAKELLKEARVVAQAVSLDEFRAHLRWLEEAAEMKGAMIALYPRHDAAKKLAVDDGEPAHQLHVTLKFLGPDHHELDDEMRGKLARSLARFAAKEQPFTAKVAGTGEFAGKPDGDDKPLVARLEHPDFQGFRERLVDALPDGVMEDTYKTFKPHMTLKYVPKSSKEKAAAKVKQLRFDAVHLVLGGEHQVFPLGAELEELYIETLHPRDRLGKWQAKLTLAHDVVQNAGVQPELAFSPGDASPAHPQRAEFRMRAAAAILENHAEIPNAVLMLPREHERRKELLKKLVKGDVERAYKEFAMTPVADLEILAGVVVATKPVYGQANTNMGARTLTMGSTSNIGDFRHELGHALRASMSGAGAPSAHTPLTTFAASQYAEAKKRVAQSIATHQPKPKTEPEWEEKIGVPDPRALDTWDENFAEQYRIYHRALFQATQPDAKAPYAFDPTALDRYRKLHPGWSRFWDSWYTAQLLSRGHDDPNAPLEEYDERLHPRDPRGRWRPDFEYRGMHSAPDRDAGSSLDDPTSAFGGDDIYGPNAKHYFGSGGGDPDMEKADWESLAAIKAARGKPDKMVTVYRAVPRVQTNAEKADDLEVGKRHVMKHGTVPPAKYGGWGDDSSHWYEWASDEIARLRSEPEPPLPDTSKINPGDWVTPSRAYAKQHGISNLGGYNDPRAFKILSSKVRAGDLFTAGDIWEWGWNPGGLEVAESGTMGLDEASWHAERLVRRYPRGTKEGGQFMPRVGARPHPLSKLKAGLLKTLVPELPRTPRQRRHEVKPVTIDGRMISVPEQRTFDRTIGGKRYVSPSGTSDVYRDGELLPPDATGSSLKLPKLGLASPKPTERVVDLDQQRIEGAARQARFAVGQGRSDRPPAIVGDEGWTTDEGLRAAGFLETKFTDRRHGLEFHYVAPDGVSRLAVTYSSDGSRVADVVWLPRTPEPVGVQLDHPPRTWAEFQADIKAFGQQYAQDIGRHALLTSVESSPEMPGHEGEHYWDGRIVLGSEVPGDILDAAVTRKMGRPLTENEKARVWLSTESGVHEALHAANPIGKDSYDSEGMLLEEALTEEIAHLETVKKLRRQGQDDVVQWFADHPTHPAALGAYASWRRALDVVLNDAKVAPEERETFLRRLKNARPDERIGLLGSAVARAGVRSDATAEQYVRGRLVDVGKPSWQNTELGPWSEFLPIVLPNVAPSDDPPKHELAGQEMLPGTRVKVLRRIRSGDTFETKDQEGVVLRVDDVRRGWTLDVKFGAETDLAVLPSQVSAVSLGPDKAAMSFGAAADHVELDGGEAIRPGDMVSYDGRADGKRSLARVVRVVRGSNPQVGVQAPNTWAVEAISSSDSLNPGQRVLLTPDRVGNDIRVASRAESLRIDPGRGRVRQLAFTLERRAQLARHFDMPNGTTLMPLGQLVPLSHPRSSRVAEEIARLQDPATSQRLAPAATPRPDGRFDVGHGAEMVHAADRVGMTHLPVRPTGQRISWKYGKPVPGDGEGGQSSFGGWGGGKQPDVAGLPVDVKKLRGKEVVKDADGKEWHVFLTGTNAKPTITLSARAVEGQPEVPDPETKTYPEADFPSGMTMVKAFEYVPPPPPKPLWDDAHTVRVKDWAGGSNGARIAYDADEKKWLVKDYRGDQDRVATELLSNAIYRKLGVRVPNAGTLDFGGKPALAYPMVEGEIKPWKEPNAELAQGFMADALLANWDVVGLDQDNVLWDEGGHPIRLDQGGTLQFRAMGGLKTFGPVPAEVWTMASPKGGQAFGRMALTDGVKRAGARKIAQVLKPGAIDELVDAAPFKNEKMRQEVRDTLKARVSWMRDYAAQKVSEPKPLEGADAFQALSQAQTSVSLYPEQQVALEAFLKGWDATVNDHLRTGAAKGPAKEEVKMIVRELDSVMRLVKAPQDVVGYAAVSKPDESVEVLGRNLRDRGFLSLSLEPGPAQKAAEKLGGSVARVLVPEGSGLLATQAVPGLEPGSSQPDLLLPRDTRLRVLSANDDRTQLETVVTQAAPGQAGSSAPGSSSGYQGGPTGKKQQPGASSLFDKEW